MRKMCAFQLEMREIHAFHLEMNKTAHYHSNLFLSWELVTEGYQGRPMKCTYFDRPLQGMKILPNFFLNQVVLHEFLLY